MIVSSIGQNKRRDVGNCNKPYHKAMKMLLLYKKVPLSVFRAHSKNNLKIKNATEMMKGKGQEEE